MSKYSEKHYVGPVCARCPEVAIKLVSVGGKPHWMCEYHFGDYKADEELLSRLQ